jgi:hypothetical protein
LNTNQNPAPSGELFFSTSLKYCNQSKSRKEFG